MNEIRLLQELRPTAGWKDLVLPARTRPALEELVADARQRRAARVSVLFHGSAGTGKTLAAEVLAGELGVSLYRVDVASVVSKYVGETEKNLARVFEGAQRGGAVLLFDEADALFRKRGEIKDSRDRYANVEVGYLLQRIEAYDGLVILASNRKKSLDAAFVRRLRHVVAFPMPGPAERRALWERAWPLELERSADVDPSRLERFELSGGAIRRVAGDAALRALAAHEPVDMRRVMDALIREHRRATKDAILTRRATIHDVSVLAPLFDAYRQFYRQPADPAGAQAWLEARLGSNESVVFVAESGDGEAIGFTQLYPTFCSVAIARTFVLYDLYVDPNQLRSGAGRALLLAAEAHARREGAARLELSTARTNLPAQALYESLGWVRDEQFHVYARRLRG